MAATLQLVLAFLPLLIFLCRQWLARNKNSPMPQWPLLGMLPSLLLSVSNNKLHELITRALRRTGGTYIFKGPSFTNSDYLVTSDPTNVHHIFSKNAANYEKGPDFKETMEPLGEGIFNVDGESWKFQRKLLHGLLNNPEFEGHSMRTLEGKMRSTLFPVLDKMSRTGDEFDLQDVIKRFMFDNLCLVVLGFDPGYLPASVGEIAGVDSRLPDCECGKAFDELEEVAIYRHIVPKCVWRLQHRLRIGMEWKCIRSWSIMDKFLYGSIKMKKKELAAKNSFAFTNDDDNDVHQTNKLDLLTQILVMKDDYGNGEKMAAKMCDKFLRDTMLTLVGAGRDTIATGLTWLIWSVVNHPTVEKRILGELRQVITERLSGDLDGEERGGFFSKDELNKLVYLHATVCETFRLYPPVPLEYKCAVEADVLPSGHKVRKDERILFPIYSMGRMEEIWGKDCMEFKPERWISERGTIIHVPSYKFMTFLTGARTCLGKTMAFTQVKSLASAMLWNYKFELTNGSSVKVAVAMVLFMKDGLKTRVSKRDHLE